MSDDSILLKESFDAGLKRSLYSNFKRWTEAYLELIDNSVSNRIPGKQLRVEIGTSPKHLRILNVGGSGMTLDGMQEFLEWGKIKSRSSHDIGSYSQGGKAAMGYLGKSMSVIAAPAGAAFGYKIEDSDLHDYRLKEYRATKVPVVMNSGIVEIEVDGLRRNIKDEEVDDLTAETYRPLIEQGSVVITHNGKKLTVVPYPLDPVFQLENFSFDVKTHDGIHKKVTGWVGRLVSRSGIKGGLRCYKLGRLIADREYFGHPDANYKQTMNFLFGEVHLDHVPATTNKTDFDRDSEEWQELENKMYLILKPHVDDLLGREIQEPTDEEKDRVNKARKIVDELLRLRKIHLGGNSFNLDNSQGQKKPESRNKDAEKRNHTQHKRRNGPATPPPPDAVGKRKRLREFMDWVVRPMDENVRSQIETNAGKKLLVINNIFPGFVQAKGTLLYLLETAALQLTVPEDDEKITPKEYLEKFDELYAFFCNNLPTAKEKLQQKNTE